MDVTFKITPLKFRPYKLLVIAGITEEDNVKVTKILSFVMIKYLDNVCYDRIFNYLYENFSFKPKIIHTDYEKALQLAISNNKYFKNDIIHSRCFFHFSKMIRGKLQQIGQCKKKLNRYNVEIISNIELLCFINMEKIKEFQKVILEHLKGDKNMTKFIRYLTNYLFKLNPQIYNYSELINYFKSKDNMLYLQNLYTSNNICESINSKLNYYLPKRTTNNYDFIKSIGKVLLNNKILNNDINMKRL